MEQAASINDYAKQLLQTATKMVASSEIVGISVIVVTKDGNKLANTASINTYEMAGMLQALAVTSSLAAQQGEMQAAQQAVQQKPGNIIVPN